MATDDEMEGAYAEARRFNTYWLSLRITGDVTAQTELTRILGIAPYVIRNRQGIARQSNPKIAVFSLAEWHDDRNSHAILQQLVAQLNDWTPSLHQLRSTYECRLDLSMSAFRYTDQGGIGFPLEFIRALADAELSLEISIQARFLWDDGEDS